MLEPRGFALDWLAFADAWRGEYQGGHGRGALRPHPVLQARCAAPAQSRPHPAAFSASKRLSEDERRDLNLAWHRLDAWPDVTRGLHRLKRRYLLAPLSNGNISLMVDLARRNDFPWDAILGRRDRRRLQAEAARLSRRGGSVRSASG